MLCGDPALFAASEGMKLLANMLDSEFSIFEGQKDENLFYSCFLFSPGCCRILTFETASSYNIKVIRHPKGNRPFLTS